MQTAETAQADERIAHVVRGANGTSYTTDHGATAGSSAGPVTVVVETGISDKVSPLVEAGSVGGDGGIGTTPYTRLDELFGYARDVAGKDGGDAGDVHITIRDGVSLYVPDAYRANNERAVIEAYSIGGSGGVGASGIGRGGSGGAVTVEMNGSLFESGAENGAVTGIWALSKGGQSGRNRTGNPIAFAFERDEDWQTSYYAGAAGGPVTVTIGKAGSIETWSALPAVLAESIGGTGLDAGYDDEGRLTPGGAGGEVIVTNDGRVETHGERAHGIVLRSVGGQGGRAVAYFEDDGAGIGGVPGAAGGDGGHVRLRQTGTVTTAGDYAFGVSAASMGGPGGNGGDSEDIFTHGGNGGAGGNGGNVEVVNTGTITTSGQGSIGLAAQSLGGGAALAAVRLSKITPGSYVGGGAGGDGTFFSKGGTGGYGGDGGRVVVDNDGSITTSGKDAYGLLAQSVGGGGGPGGDAGGFAILLGVARGGDGGAGGNGGTVRIRPSADGKRGSIVTSGNNASGIIAQSIGGGGGAGGSATSKTGGIVSAISVSIGGDGGDGGTSGRVSIDNTSNVTTSGVGAHGVEASSIGGGGGRAGDASAYAVAVGLPDVPTFSMTYALGGSGGKGGAGSTATVVNRADIKTSGDSAVGMLISSIGGGGGNGAAASSISDMLGVSYNFGVSLGIGGTGGGGGDGGEALATNRGTITTSGAFSPAMQVVSIGGGGGNGGPGSSSVKAGLTTDSSLGGYILETAAGSIPNGASLGVSISVGGDGAGAGAGGRASATNASSVLTRGSSSTGLLVQSVGGGGGNGGGYLTASSTDGAARLGVGGKGGKGGDGGVATATNARNASITTYGDGSFGMQAQSVGGGGGNGGAFGDSTEPQGNAVTDVASSVVKIANYLVQGNDLLSKVAGNSVDWLNENSSFQLKLLGAKSILSGIKAGLAQAKQDIEDARRNVARQVAAGNDGSLSAKAALEEVERRIDYKKIYTDALVEAVKTAAIKDLIARVTSVTQYLAKEGWANGKLKESPIPVPITLDVQVGGKGGDGGKGGEVTATNEGSITTHGAIAHAMLAQSIGGGGGTAGGSVTVGPGVFDINMTIGNRSGGASGAGASATLTNSGAIATTGNAAFGMLGQSIGGGGGLVAATSSKAMTAAMNAKVSLGASINSLADGGAVTLVNSGLITTGGKEAHGIVAQSIGGGGGVYVINRRDPADAETLAASQEEADALKALDALLADAASEAGDHSLDLKALREAEASGIPAAKVTAQFGGAGYASNNPFGGSGSEVKVTTSGTIATAGLGAIGVVAQSIGAGGGLGADASSQNKPVTFDLTFGGLSSSDTQRNAGGDGGKVTLTLGSGARIVTAGDGAYGALLQSIGGGGGYGGVGTGQIKMASVYDLAETTRRVNGWVPSYGHGGDIKVGMDDPSSRMSILTTGKRAHGLFIQSLTGGGGAAFDVNGTDVAPITSAASRPIRRFKSFVWGIIEDTYDEHTDPPGKSDHYTPNWHTGHAGKVTLDTRGDIIATGKDAYGVFIQAGRQKTDGSIDSRVAYWSGSADITHDGTIWGGSGTGAGIRIDAAGANTVKLTAGSLMGAASELALISRLGTTSLTNWGTIEGDVLLSSGANQFLTEAGGTYRSRSGTGAVEMGGRGSSFESRGTLDIGGRGSVAVLNVTAEKVVLSGAMLADVTSSAASAYRQDTLRASGTVTARDLMISPYAVDQLVPQSFALISSTGRLTASQITTLAREGNPISWSTSNTDHTLSVTPSARFRTPESQSDAWNDNERRLADGLQQSWDRDPWPSAAIFAQIANLTSAEDYRQAVDSQSSEGQQAPAITQTLAARSSLSAAMSCPIFVDDGVMITESQCAWGKVTASRITMDDTSAADGFSQNGITMRAGAQWEVAKDWFMGVSGAYSTTDLDANDGYTSVDGQAGDVSMAIKHQMGPLLLSAAMQGSYGRFDTSRLFDFESEAWRASSASDIWTAGFRLRAAYEFVLPNPNFYLRPYVDLDALYTYVPGAGTDTGEGVSLTSEAMREWSFAVSPAVEVGARIDLSGGGWLRPFATAGVTFLSNDGMSQALSFDTDSRQGIDFVSEVQLPDTLVDLGAGLQFVAGNGYELRGEYRAQIGDAYLAQEASIRLSVPF
ncbi:autotransporter [Ancylobacter sonchi]